MTADATKKCPMCGEEILAVAIKCKHCGERLDTATSPVASAPTEGRASSTTAQQETTLFSAAGTLVTTARAVIGGTTYSIPNVTSVASTQLPPDTSAAGLLNVIGGALIIAGAFFTMLILVALKDGSVIGALVDAILGAGLVGCGVAVRRRAAVLRKSATPTFVLKITTAGGEVEALRTKDKSLLDGLVASLTAAIAKR